MALSLLVQPPNLLDLQTFFDPFPFQLQTHEQQLLHHTQCDDPEQMEYTNHNQYHNNSNSNSNSSSASAYITDNNSGIIINNNNNNTAQNTPNNSNSTSNNNIYQSNTGNINQTFGNINRGYMSGYNHQHIGTDYEQVINFVDSPPNSEESWTDDQSKGSPGPQIIDVQTIYSNSGSRKRRMDWDTLDIGQSGNTASAQQSEELSTKVPHLEKDKHKRDKSSGRSSWTDDIGFDLNAEFNNSSYLNNESFLSFSPALTQLKQEPQTEQLKVNKILLSAPHPAGDAKKSAKQAVQVEPRKDAAEGPSTDQANAVCGSGSPKGTQQEKLELNAATEKVGSGVANGEPNTSQPIYDEAINTRNSAALQSLTVVDASKIENPPSVEDHKFQYILAAATSIATKNNEETLTYLNQGQSYEIKLKKIGDLSFYRDKILKSVIKICFHERRLQFMEREQMQQWQANRPGERIIEVDVPLSYGLCHVSQPLNPNFLNTVEIFWDPLKEVGVYIKVNCISTEFTPKKHGGEKGVPFRLQIETYIESTNNAGAQASSIANIASPGTPGNMTPNNNNSHTSISSFGVAKDAVHAAACQIKVFKLKGADRKHKQDREKIQKRPQCEQDKFQPSYECTIMNDIPLDLIPPNPAGCFSPEYMKIWPNSPVHIPKYDGILSHASSSPAANSSPIAINSVTSTNSPTLKLMESNMLSPPQVAADFDDYFMNIMPDSTPAQVAQWLTNHRLTTYLPTFTHFSGSDVMRMSKEDLIQICGLADGIRMFNILRAKAISPRLTIYASMDGTSYNAIYLVSCTAKELAQKLFKLPGFYEMMANAGTDHSMENGGALYNNWNMHSKYSGSGSNIFNDVNKSCIYVSGPSGVRVLVTDEVLGNEIKDGNLYALEVQYGKVVMKAVVNKNDN